MTSRQIREEFFEFFKAKGHVIVPSAPIVIKNDPTLMFTNAGMNQFKDLFLGNSVINDSRVADSQKCLRVSGKHNDLEEVGVDTYHHTMFEMLGNWSFGDYYKKDAIGWAWELLTEVYKIPKENLYATYFGGDKGDKLPADEEAINLWKQFLPDSQILPGSKQDNFWEMGESGPCGPCSEIHIDIRSEEEKKKISGADLVNKDHPEVIEIWNLVFMEMNRLANGSLESLPNKHIDTGMGFERLVMVVQGKKSNYDTDVFMPVITQLEELSGFKYEASDSKRDVAFRVISDHIRAITFTIADGQLPSNVGPGYVIRRILRRAVRYSYQFLKIREPFLFKLVDTLVTQMGDVFENLTRQAGLVKNVLLEEETSFLRTVEQGFKRIETFFDTDPKAIDGDFAFELYDTYGFPFDLTSLIAREFKLDVDEKGFLENLEKQKSRSRDAGKVQTGDWVVLLKDDVEEFIGYDYTNARVQITRYREVIVKKKKRYQLVFNFTPFYAESGGQIGDKGLIISNDERVQIVDTKVENNVIVHIVEELPKTLNVTFKALVDTDKRDSIMANHSATHLLHKALRRKIGKHVEQKGSFVSFTHLRFDFSHYSKLSDEELQLIEGEINGIIRKGIELEEHRSVPMQKAEQMGAMMLFGEKYGDVVRVVKFGDSIELCGGTHVQNTSQIGRFKIISESAIASGVRRIEAVTSYEADKLIDIALTEYNEVRKTLKVKQKISQFVKDLLSENHQLKKDVENLNKYKISAVKQDLISKIEQKETYRILKSKCELSPSGAKDLAFQLKDQFDDLFIVLGTLDNNKPGITIAIGKKIISEKDLKAGTIIRQVAKHIRGGGGGQDFFAQAGGSDPEGLDIAMDEAEGIVISVF
ncbi:MAG: alanine--tRNA ligase [Bacteroidetes bacterium]|nr:MAG: alanine--tRNA ligase [Bacteroidota bacterium]